MTAQAGSNQREEFRQRFGELARHGRKFDKAIDTVLGGGVKETRFVPSGRRIFTVVGTLGDEFIDPERPYCSCSDFFFRVGSGMEELCYHLLSYKIASRSGRVDVTEFDDEEYAQVLKAVVIDVLDVMNRS
jgi:predicted nucleic acid-binding Zn finger protein